MDLQPLKTFIARHELETAPAYSLLDITAQLGELVRAHLKATNYGRNPEPMDHTHMREQIGNLMFALAYLSTLYDVDPEAAMQESIERFESKLQG